MVDRFDQNDRRVLKVPAVPPCSGISPATLLDSLISLSRTVLTYQSKYFPTHRTFARKIIRHIEILSIFYEEIWSRCSALSDSAMLCLSELHIATQRIRFLLEDCTREGARIYILMKAHHVATQFLVSIRAIATALDIIQYNSMNLSFEIKELVEMVANQSRKSRLELDPDDEYEMKRVIMILNQFENKFEPSPRIIKRVLGYLDIKTWGDCQKEVKFLEEEISSQHTDNNERDVPLLSSLVGFISYCRGVLFEESNLQNSDYQSEVRTNVEFISCLNPEDFKCPISLELMMDPVTVSTGQTYDRASIENWLKLGNLICPKTREKLVNTELVPNLNLRKLIQQFCSDHGISLSRSRKKNRDLSRTIIPGTLAAEESIKFLGKFLASRLQNGNNEQKNKAAYEIRLLAKSNIFNRQCLIESGTIPPLLILLHSTDPSIQENAISALLKLSKHSTGKKLIIDNGGLELITKALKDGPKQESRQIAAATIFYLSSVPKYQRRIAETQDLIPSLARLIKTGTTCGKKNVLAALFGILQNPRNHHTVISSGVVPSIVDHLDFADKPELIGDSLAVLSTLAESFDGSDSILKASALSRLLRVLRSSTSQAEKEHCVSIFWSFYNNFGDEVIADLTKCDSLMESLYSASTQGTNQGRKKARLLLRTLHRFIEIRDSILVGNSSEGPVDRFIPVT